MATINYKDFRVDSDTAVQDLQKVLDDLSNPSVYSTLDYVELSLDEIDITPTILALLIQILNHPLPIGCSGKELYWDSVALIECKFLQEETTNRQSAANESIQSFGEALAHRPDRLGLIHSPDILECLYNTHHLELKVTTLLVQQDRLSALECIRLGSLVQRAISLNLEIVVNDFEEPLVFGERLAKAVHLQNVSFGTIMNLDLLDTLISDGDCVVRTLLSPQSRLEKLILSAINLTDHHLQLIAAMLPTSQLRALDVSASRVGRDGIFALARQLPNIKYLKDLALNSYSWEPYIYVCDQKQAMYRECIAALLHGMFENYSIEHFRLCRWVEALQYLIKSNRIRGRILATGLSIPTGLWPLILGLVASWQWDPIWGEEVKFRNHRINALYFALHNCPILSSVSSRHRRARKRPLQDTR